MNRLTDPLRQVARDLIEKKLWPIAAVLLVALVAVPVVIGSSAKDAPEPAPLAATAPAGNGAQKSLVSVADPAAAEAAEKKGRGGKIDDPFYDPPEPPKQDDGTGSGETASSDATSAGGTATATEDVPSTGTAPTEPTVATVQPAYYRTEVRWYAGARSKPTPIRRLAPLGGLANTAALYLGVTKSKGNYAVFLLGPNATSDGEAECEDANCRIIGLKAGETQLVTVEPTDGGEARQYTLEVVAVERVTADAAEARKMRLKVHPEGRDVMREMWSDGSTAEALRPVQFDRDSGLLYKGSETATGADTAAQKLSE